MTRPLQPSLVTELFSDPRALRPHFPRSYIPNSRLLSFGRVPNLIATFQGCFLDLIAVCVLNPSGVADSSQIMDQAQCVSWVVGMYLRAATPTFRLHNHTHGSHPTLRVIVVFLARKYLGHDQLRSSPRRAGNVCFWHKADVAALLSDVCFWG